jgi:hypothetical protein
MIILEQRSIAWRPRTPDPAAGTINSWSFYLDVYFAVEPQPSGRLAGKRHYQGQEMSIYQKDNRNEH